MARRIRRWAATWWIGPVVGLGLLGAVAGSPAGADSLVTREGTVVETDGPWRVEGRQVLFKDSTGKLAMLRLEDVDLAASEAATRRRQEAPLRESRLEERSEGEGLVRARVRRRSESSVVVTDADVAHLDPELMAAVPQRPPPVILYSTSWCGWCKKTRQVLEALGVPYVDKDVETSREAALEHARKAGAGAGVPVLDVGGIIIRGFDPQGIVAALRARATGESGP